MKLHKKERCPIHKSFFCCGRDHVARKPRHVASVQSIDDPHDPGGYREIRSSAEMKKLLTRKIVEQDMKCGIWGEPFDDCNGKS